MDFICEVDVFFPDLYYLSFPKDSLVPRLLVYGVFLVDTAQVVLVTSDVFNSYARHYGDLEVLDSMQNEWLAVPVFSSIGNSSCVSRD